MHKTCTKIVIGTLDISGLTFERLRQRNNTERTGSNQTQFASFVKKIIFPDNKESRSLGDTLKNKYNCKAIIEYR